MAEGLGVNQAGMLANMKGEIRDKQAVRKKRDKEDGVRDYSQSGEPVDMMLVEIPTYLRTTNEGGRKRNERFRRRGLYVNGRRRSSRQRRVILWRRRNGSSEGKGGSNNGGESDVGNRA
jgi:hypothetical protein